MPKLSQTSERNLLGVNQKLINLVHLAILNTPIDFRVTDGLHSLSEQRHLVELGASQSLNSRHVTGDAVDLVPWINGKPKWEWPLIYPMAEHIRKCAKDLNLGIRWGGCWHISCFTTTVSSAESLVQAYINKCNSEHRKPFLDGPHFELCAKEI